MERQLTARQLACKVIHEDKANVSNPSIMAKYMKKYANDKQNKIIEEIEKWKLNTQHFGTGNQIIDDIIKIIKKEIK